ncbi:MAG: starch-binding protein [Bacteroidetes bacterium]|nr:starch-binding protein [Bacteroidota bacterium]
MKKISLFLLACLTIITSCSYDPEQLYDKERAPVAPVLSIEGATNFLITDDLPDFYYTVLTWSRANFGKDIPVSYVLLISDNEDIVGSFKSIILGEDICLRALSAAELYGWAVDDFGTYNSETGKKDPATLYFRIAAQASGGAQPVYSNVESITSSLPAPTTVRWTVYRGGWNEMAVYVWGDSQLFGDWPGALVTSDINGWYSVVIPYKFNANLIINNNGDGKQLDLINIPAKNAEDVDLYVNLETGDIFRTPPITVSWTVVAGSWTDMYVYSWGDDVQLFGDWPGRKLTPNADGSFSVDVPSEGEVHLIINNNEGQQTNLIDNPDGNTSLYVDLNTGDVSTGPKVVKWKVVNGNWDALYLYSWGTDNSYHGGWPGTLMTPDAYGWYSVTIPPGYDQHLIINNNSGSQHDLPYPTVNAQYEVDLTAGTFVQADEWSITIRWKQPADEWGGQMAIYAWGGAPDFDTFGGWPGQVVTADANGWYSVTVPPGQTVGNAIFNNNGGGLQFDVNLNITSDVCLEITGSTFSVVSGD